MGLPVKHDIIPAVLTIAAFLAIGFILRQIFGAKEGYQDEKGFHFGTAPVPPEVVESKKAS
jgi:hypothetical protein